VDSERVAAPISHADYAGLVGPESEASAGEEGRWCTNRQPEETRCQRFLDLRVK
jgi:hypothetical protein